MTQPKYPTLHELLQCWNAAHPSEPQLHLHATGERVEIKQNPSKPGPWRDAWGHSRLRDAGTQYMQVRLRPDGDVDVRQRKSFSGAWEETRVYPIDLWRGEGWLLRTSRQSIEQWNATHSIGDVVRYWPEDIYWRSEAGRTRPIKGVVASKAELFNCRDAAQIEGVGPIPLERIEPSL